MNNNIIVYGEDARDWLAFGLDDMKNRMGWEFPEEIEKFLLESIEELGIDVSSPRNLMSFTDNAFVNGSWGQLDEFSYSEEEAEQMVENGSAMYFNKDSGWFIEHL